MKQVDRKKRKLSDSNSMGVEEQRRIMPHVVDFENAVIGALLINNQLFATIEGILQPDSFYSEANKAIFAAIVELNATRTPIDALSVIEQLKRRGELEAVGGASYIAELTINADAGMHRIDHYARIISQKHLSRNLILFASEIQSRAFDETEDISDVLETAESKFTEISINGAACPEPIELSQAIHNVLDKAAKTQEERQSGKIPAIPTGISSLDRALYGGWRSPDLIILAGRPSMGKTQLAVHFSKSAAEAGKEVLFVSLEMTGTQLANRILLEDDRISAHNLMTGQMSTDEWQALDSQAGRFWNLKLRISDSVGSRELMNICSESRRLKRKGKLDMLVIDYLGYILTGNQKFERRQLEIAKITSSLKSLAKELDVPIMLLCQLSRPDKGAAVREPQLHDLRESGDIEQDADVVLFVHRPTYYDADKYADEWDGKGKIIIGKYREGVRDRAVVFCHDKNFKKIWGDNGFSKKLSGIPQPVDYSEPRGGFESPF
jgi:replicative DNA helicase